MYAPGSVLDERIDTGPVIEQRIVLFTPSLNIPLF